MAVAHDVLELSHNRVFAAQSGALPGGGVCGGVPRAGGPLRVGSAGRLAERG